MTAAAQRGSELARARGLAERSHLPWIDLDGERIQTRTVLWAAGVRASPIGESLGAELDRSGRVIVEPDLSLPGHPEVYVVGDLALAMQDGKPVPGVAQGALQGGRHAASCIVASLSGKPSTPFRYRDKGMLAAIGRAAAVADLPNIELTGFPAWVIWGAVHIYFLIGFRNRLFVMAHWSWAFLTHDRGARLITGSPTLRSRWEKPRH